MIPKGGFNHMERNAIVISMYGGLVDQVYSDFDSQVLIVDDRQSDEDTTFQGKTVE